MPPEDKASDLQPDELVEKLVGDPSGAVPEVLVLTGWVGRSTREGHMRIYLTADLSEYVSFRTSDVLHAAKLQAEGGLAATRVWLREAAEIQHTRRLPGTEARRFLGGPVSSAFLARFGRGWGGISVGGSRGGVLVSVPPQASVCFSCPTEGGEDTCVPATCTLATSC